MPAFVGARRALLGRRAVAAPPPSPYDSDATAYFARMSTQEGTTFKGAVNTCVLALKAGLSTWAKLDHTFLGATQHAANAVYDLRRADKVFSLGTGATHTAFRGVAGTGSAVAVVWPGFLDASGNLFAEDSASFGVWCNLSDDVGTTRVPHFGGVSASRSTYMANANGGIEFARVNQTADSTGVRTSSSRVGHRAGSRTADTTTRYSFNGVFTTQHANASEAPNAVNACLGANGASYTADRFGLGWSGAGLSDAEIAEVHAAFAALMSTLESL